MKQRKNWQLVLNPKIRHGGTCIITKAENLVQNLFSQKILSKEEETMATNGGSSSQGGNNMASTSPRQSGKKVATSQ